jgi:CheY-like chemotaxis protein
VPTTLLAVDDSATMRKVLEMTFAGEDYKVVTANSADAALALAKTERPSIVVSDITLDGKSGYDFCTAFKRDNPNVPVLLLSSKLHPYDAGKGQACRADDHMDKPFDSQQMLDRVRTLLSSPRPAVAPAPQAAAKPAIPGAPYRAPAVPQTPSAPAVVQRSVVSFASPKPAPAQPVVAPAAPVRKTTPAATPAVNLRTTQEYSSRAISASIAQRTAPGAVASAAPAAHPVPHAPAQAPVPSSVRPAPSSSGTTAVSPVSPVVAAAASSSGVSLPADMSKKLSDLGLSKDQVEAVLALSRDVVERVVWEVVPVLAETMIKEEIKRLTAD